MIADDESRHLAYTHEALLRFCELGHGALIRDMLARYAKAEVRTYRDVSLGVMRRMGECLGWSWVKRAVLGFGIHAIYQVERLHSWRRMTTLSMPAQRNAMAPGGSQQPRVA
jgi:hypothetical protein